MTEWQTSRLKSVCPKGRAGSNPAPGTQTSTFRRLVSSAISRDPAPGVNVTGMRENTAHVRSSHRGYSSSPICYWHSRQGECPDLRRIGRHHPALAQRSSTWAALSPRCLPHDENQCPRCHGRAMDEAAYAYLLGLYLGDGHITRGRRDVFALLSLFCDDWPGLMAAARTAMSAVMPASSVFCVQQQGCTRLRALPSTGRACSLSMARDASTCGKSSSSNGNGHRAKIPRRIRQGTVPFRWLARCQPSAANACGW